MKKILSGQISVSVIVPCYNEENYLQSTLNSIMLADHPCVCEIIVLDDHSTDNTLTIAENTRQINSKVVVISNERNLGAVGNSNKGLSLAKGNYVHFLSANDIIMPDFYKTINDTIPPDFRGICSTMGIKFTNRNDASLFRSHALSVNANSIQYLGPTTSSKKLIGDSWMIGQSVIYERDTLRSLGGFIEDLGGFCDLVIMTEIITSYGAIFIPRPLCGIRLHSNTFLISQCANDHSLHKIMNVLKENQALNLKKASYKSQIYKSLQDRVIFTALRPLNNPKLSPYQRKKKYNDIANKGRMFPDAFYSNDLLFFLITRWRHIFTLLFFRFFLVSIYRKINADEINNALENLRSIEVSVIN